MPKTDEFSETALQALKDAVTKTLDRKRKLGQYAVFIKNGKPVKVPAEQLLSDSKTPPEIDL